MAEDGAETHGLSVFGDLKYPVDFDHFDYVTLDAGTSAVWVATSGADAVRRLSEQLADAKRREDDALLDSRHADLQLAKAQQALTRARER